MNQIVKVAIKMDEKSIEMSGRRVKNFGIRGNKSKMKKGRKTDFEYVWLSCACFTSRLNDAMVAFRHWIFLWLN